MPKNSNPNPSPETRFGEGNAGRPAGSLNVYSKKRAEAAARMAGLNAEQFPLHMMLKVMNGEPFPYYVRIPGDQRKNKRVVRWYYPTPEDMLRAARDAAPYMHPKLANIEHSGNVAVKHEDFIDRLIAEENGANTIEHEPRD